MRLVGVLTCVCLISPQLHDRILEVDGTTLGDRLLSDTMKPAPKHTFVSERWVLGGDGDKADKTRAPFSIDKSANLIHRACPGDTADKTLHCAVRSR